MIWNFVSQQYDIIGIIGVAMILVTYFLLQLEQLSARNLWYSLLNLIGSVLILISLYFTWNLASVIIEVAWLLISAYGVARFFLRKNKA